MKAISEIAQAHGADAQAVIMRFGPRKFIPADRSGPSFERSRLRSRAYC
jgi:hypothetical protein